MITGDASAVHFRLAETHHHPPTFQSPDVSLAVRKQSLTGGFWKLKHNFNLITFIYTRAILTIYEIWIVKDSSSTLLVIINMIPIK